MLGSRRQVNPMKKVPLSVIKDDLSKYLRLAESEEIVITRHGKPAGVLVGFETEDDWFDYRLENDPAFLRRIELARQGIRGKRYSARGYSRLAMTMARSHLVERSVTRWYHCTTKCVRGADLLANAHEDRKAWIEQGAQNNKLPNS